MNFRGHISGGIVGAIIVVSLIAFFHIEQKIGISSPYNLLIIAGLIIFFSMYPDFDIASIPQHWFFRCLFIVLCILFSLKEYLTISILSIISIIPLLHKHRGLTHMVTFSCVFPIMIAYIIEYYVFGNILSVIEMIKKYGIYTSCSTFGWWIHLLLDNVKTKKLK